MGINRDFHIDLGVFAGTSLMFYTSNADDHRGY